MTAEQIMSEEYFTELRTYRYTKSIIEEHSLNPEDYIRDSSCRIRKGMFCLRSILEWLGY